MFSFPAFFLLLALLLPFQTPRDSIRIHYERAEASRGRGDLGRAEAEYKAILGEAYNKLGKVSAALPDYPGSVSAFEAGSAYQPESNEALIDLAIAYFHVQKFDNALEPLNRAVSLYPNSAGAHHMLGKTYSCWESLIRPWTSFKQL